MYITHGGQIESNTVKIQSTFYEVCNLKIYSKYNLRSTDKTKVGYKITTFHFSTRQKHAQFNQTGLKYLNVWRKTSKWEV